MKKIIKLVLISLFLIPNHYIKALDEYSEFSINKPTNVNSSDIKTETRFLYYKLKEGNIEYKKLGTSNREHVDMNDFKYEYAYDTLESVEQTDDNRVTCYETDLIYYPSEVLYIMITNLGYEEEELHLKDIYFYNSITNTPLYVEPYESSNIFTYSPNDIIIYKDGRIVYKLDETFNDGEKLKISYTLVHNKKKTKDYKIMYYDPEYNEINYSVKMHNTESEDISIETSPKEGIPWLKREVNERGNTCRVEDKVYKYYDLVREDIGYYTSLEGDYLKDPEGVTFYSYKLTKENNKVEETKKEEGKNKSSFSNEEDKEEIKKDNDSNTKKNNNKKNTKTNSINNSVKHTYEYLNDYPLEIEEDNVSLEKTSLTNEEDSIKEDNLIAYKTETNKVKEDNPNITSKLFMVFSIIGITILLFILFIYKVRHRENFS